LVGGGLSDRGDPEKRQKKKPDKNSSRLAGLPVGPRWESLSNREEMKPGKRRRANPDLLTGRVLWEKRATEKQKRGTQACVVSAPYFFF